MRTVAQTVPQTTPPPLRLRMFVFMHMCDGGDDLIVIAMGVVGRGTVVMIMLLCECEHTHNVSPPVASES